MPEVFRRASLCWCLFQAAGWIFFVHYEKVGQLFPTFALVDTTKKIG